MLKFMNNLKNMALPIKAVKICICMTALGTMSLLLYSCKPEQEVHVSNMPVSVLTGQWKTIDEESGKEKAIVEIYQFEGKFYGKITKLLIPEDQGKVFEKGQGEDKNKPILGLIILKGLSPDGDEYSGGTITDPNNGKTYKCIIEVQDDGAKLKIRGYIGLSLAGRTQYWYRVK